MNIKEVEQTEGIIDKLIEISRGRESEHSCTGYGASEYSDMGWNQYVSDIVKNDVKYIFLSTATMYLTFLY